MHKHVLDIWVYYQDCLMLLVFIISQIVVNRENATEKVIRGSPFLGAGQRESGSDKGSTLCFCLSKSRRDLDQPRCVCNISMQNTHAFVHFLLFLMVTLTHQSVIFSLSHFPSLSLREHPCAVAHSCIFHDYPLEFLWKTMSYSCHHILALCARATH